MRSRFLSSQKCTGTWPRSPALQRPLWMVHSLLIERHTSGEQVLWGSNVQKTGCPLKRVGVPKSNLQKRESTTGINFFPKRASKFRLFQQNTSSRIFRQNTRPEERVRMALLCVINLLVGSAGNIAISQAFLGYLAAKPRRWRFTASNGCFVSWDHP